MVTSCWLTEEVSVRVFRCTVSNELFPGSLILGIYQEPLGKQPRSLIIWLSALTSYWSVVNVWCDFPTWSTELNWICFRLLYRCERTCKKEAFVLYKLPQLLCSKAEIRHTFTHKLQSRIWRQEMGLECILSGFYSGSLGRVLFGITKCTGRNSREIERQRKREKKGDFS